MHKYIYIFIYIFVYIFLYLHILLEKQNFTNKQVPNIIKKIITMAQMQYQDVHAQLISMGFNNNQMNTTALLNSNGDIQNAIELLISYDTDGVMVVGNNNNSSNNNK